MGEKSGGRVTGTEGTAAQQPLRVAAASWSGQDYNRSRKLSRSKLFGAAALILSA